MAGDVIEQEKSYERSKIEQSIKEKAELEEKIKNMGFFSQKNAEEIMKIIDRQFNENLEYFTGRSGFCDALKGILEENPEDERLLTKLREELSRYMSENWNVNEHYINKERKFKVLSYKAAEHYGKKGFDVKISLPTGKKINYYICDYGDNEKITDEQMGYFENHSFSSNEYLEILMSLRDYFNSLGAKVGEDLKTIEEFSNDAKFMELCHSLTSIPYMGKFNGYYIGEGKNKKIFIQSE